MKRPNNFFFDPENFQDQDSDKNAKTKTNEPTQIQKLEARYKKNIEKLKVILLLF